MYRFAANSETLLVIISLATELVQTISNILPFTHFKNERFIFIHFIFKWFLNNYDVTSMPPQRGCTRYLFVLWLTKPLSPLAEEKHPVCLPDLFFVNLSYLSYLWFCLTEVKWSMFFILYVLRGWHWTASHNLKVKASSPCRSSFFLVNWFILNKHICWRISLLSNIANESFLYTWQGIERQITEGKYQGQMDRWQGRYYKV